MQTIEQVLNISKAGWEMSVRVWKGGFMVETMGHSNLGSNVVLETLELYISSVSSSTGRHGRTPEGHGRPQAAEAGSCAQASAQTPLTTPPGPLKLYLFGEVSIYE